MTSWSSCLKIGDLAIEEVLIYKALGNAGKRLNQTVDCHLTCYAAVRTCVFLSFSDSLSRRSPYSISVWHALEQRDSDRFHSVSCREEGGPHPPRHTRVHRTPGHSDSTPREAHNPENSRSQSLRHECFRSWDSPDDTFHLSEDSFRDHSLHTHPWPVP